MKRQFNLKSFVAGMIVSILLFTTIFAAPIQKTIKVFTNNYKIYVDEKLISTLDIKGNPVEPISYNGTIYLPIRAVSSALGKSVNWDSKTNSVFIGKYEGSNKSIYLTDFDYFNFKKEGALTYVYDWNSLENKDNTGKQYKNGILFNLGYNSKAYYEYLTEQKFKSLKGSFILEYEDRSTEDQAILKIYGDDQLIYTSDPMTAGVLPIDFDVDITGVLKLRIEVEETGGYSYGTFGVVDAVLYE